MTRSHPRNHNSPISDSQWPPLVHSPNKPTLQSQIDDLKGTNRRLYNSNKALHNSHDQLTQDVAALRGTLMRHLLLKDDTSDKLTVLEEKVQSLDESLAAHWADSQHVHAKLGRRKEAVRKLKGVRQQCEWLTGDVEEIKGDVRELMDDMERRIAVADARRIFAVGSSLLEGLVDELGELRGRMVGGAHSQGSGSPSWEHSGAESEAPCYESREASIIDDLLPSVEEGSVAEEASGADEKSSASEKDCNIACDYDDDSGDDAMYSGPLGGFRHVN